MFRPLIAAAIALVATVQPVTGMASTPIEPRTLTWNIVSDQEMSRICRGHGLRANCEGMAAWDKEFRMCIIWTRSPRGEDDAQRWEVVHHELRHCQDGQFHH